MEKKDNLLSRMEYNKIIALENIGTFKKAILIQGIEGIKFDESNFKVNFDLSTFSPSPESLLSVGDICRIKNDFYSELVKTQPKDERGVPLRWNMKGFSPGKWDDDCEYILIAFVEMNGKNCKKTFCALRMIPGAEFSWDSILGNKDTLLLFYPEGLIKVR